MSTIPPYFFLSTQEEQRRQSIMLPSRALNVCLERLDGSNVNLTQGPLESLGGLLLLHLGSVASAAACMMLELSDDRGRRDPRLAYLYPELYMYLVYQLASYHTVVSGWVGRVQFRLIVRSAETSSRGTAATSG